MLTVGVFNLVNKGRTNTERAQGNSYGRTTSRLPPIVGNTKFHLNDAQNLRKSTTIS